MTRKQKLYIVDGIILAIDLMFFMFYDYSFSPMRFVNFAITLLVVIGSVVAHYFAYTNITDEKTEEEDRINSIISKELAEIEACNVRLREIEKAHPEYSHAIRKIKAQFKSFFEKEKALTMLIKLNNGASETFLMSKNSDVRRSLLKNMKKFIKRLIAYSVKSDRDYSNGNVEEDADVSVILENNSKMITIYDELLDEVARMGDDFNLEDPGLQNVIENLQLLRVGAEDEIDDDEDDEIQLFVTTDNDSM